MRKVGVCVCETASQSMSHYGTVKKEFLIDKPNKLKTRSLCQKQKCYRKPKGTTNMINGYQIVFHCIINISSSFHQLYIEQTYFQRKSTIQYSKYQSHPALSNLVGEYSFELENLVFQLLSCSSVAQVTLPHCHGKNFGVLACAWDAPMPGQLYGPHMTRN